MSSLAPAEIKKGIIRGDVSFLKTIKGIGPKSAQRIIIELQDVLAKDAPEGFAGITSKSRTGDEAISALVMLGFNKIQADKVVEKVLKENNPDISVEELIKMALRMI